MQHFNRNISWSYCSFLGHNSNTKLRKRNQNAAEREILATFRSSKRQHSKTGPRESASASYTLTMVTLNWSPHSTKRMTP